MSDCHARRLFQWLLQWLWCRGQVHGRWEHQCSTCVAQNLLPLQLPYCYLLCQPSRRLQPCSRRKDHCPCGSDFRDRTCHNIRNDVPCRMELDDCTASLSKSCCLACVCFPGRILRVGEVMIPYLELRTASFLFCTISLIKGLTAIHNLESTWKTGEPSCLCLVCFLSSKDISTH